jgi:hypothetical protein
MATGRGNKKWARAETPGLPAADLWDRLHRTCAVREDICSGGA